MTMRDCLLPTWLCDRRDVQVCVFVRVALQCASARPPAVCFVSQLSRWPQEFDHNDNGLMSREEFVSMLQRMAAADGSEDPAG